MQTQTKQAQEPTIVDREGRKRVLTTQPRTTGIQPRTPRAARPGTAAKEIVDRMRAARGFWPSE
jgi:hypothetical protein